MHEDTTNRDGGQPLDAARAFIDPNGTKATDSAHDPTSMGSSNDVDASDRTDERPRPAAGVMGRAGTAADPVLASDDRAPHRPASMPELPDLRVTVSPQADAPSPEERSRDEFTTVYDVIDALSRSLEEAKGGWFTPNMIKVDRTEFSERIDELKAMLPVQLERASALMREAERRLESAQMQANAIVSSAQSRAADMVREAQDQAEFLAGQENVTELARKKARTILDRAQATSDRLTQGADRYCTTSMEGLRQQIDKLGQDVQAGLQVLAERREAAQEQLPHLSHGDYPEA